MGTSVIRDSERAAWGDRHPPGVWTSSRCAAVPAGGIPDWHQARSYLRLCACDAPHIAWEWLRRDPAYRAAAQSGIGAARFGLHRFEDPERDGAAARIWWRSEVDPFVLAAVARPCARRDTFCPGQLSIAACVERLAGRERLLVTDGARSLRIDIIAGTLLGGPVHLAWVLPGIARAAPAIDALGRFLRLCQTGRLLPGRHPTPAQARRWAKLLRVRDALDAGATQREIAEVLFGPVTGRRWRIHAPARRSQVQRLVHEARRLSTLPAAHFLVPGATGHGDSIGRLRGRTGGD